MTDDVVTTKHYTELNFTACFQTFCVQMVSLLLNVFAHCLSQSFVFECLAFSLHSVYKTQPIISVVFNFTNHNVTY